MRRIGLLAGMILIAVAAPSLADSSHRFTVKNSNASLSITRIWYVPSSDGPWRELDKPTEIKPKTSSTIAVSSQDLCIFDVKVQFSDGVSQVFENVNACKGDTVVAT